MSQPEFEANSFPLYRFTAVFEIAGQGYASNSKNELKNNLLGERSRMRERATSEFVANHCIL